MGRLAAVCACLLITVACQSGDSASGQPRQSHSVRYARTERRATYDTHALIRSLRRHGRDARIIKTAPTPSAEPLGVAPVFVCTRHLPLHVYEYDSQAERQGHSRGIDASGSTIRTPSGSISQVEWVGPPHFYARGRLIVLYLGGEAADATLTQIMGRALTTPRAGTSLDRSC